MENKQLVIGIFSVAAGLVIGTSAVLNAQINPVRKGGASNPNYLDYTVRPSAPAGSFNPYYKRTVNIPQNRDHRLFREGVPAVRDFYGIPGRTYVPETMFEAAPEPVADTSVCEILLELAEDGDKSARELGERYCE